MTKKKIDRGSVFYAVAREQTLRLADKKREFQVLDVFNAIQWQIGFVGMPAKEINGYAQAAVDGLVKEREIEIVTEYSGRPRGWVFRRAGVLDRIVGALEQDER